MPTKEGECGRDQDLDVEILPPSVILCTGKMKVVGKHLPSLPRGAVEACRSAACGG